MKAKLIVYKENHLLQQIELEHFKTNGSDYSEFLIGRSDECQVVLDDHQISRLHAVIYCKDGHWGLEKKSTFGIISINGIPIEKKDLASGDIVSISLFQIQFVEEKKNFSQLEIVGSDKEGQRTAADESETNTINIGVEEGKTDKNNDDSAQEQKLRSDNNKLENAENVLDANANSNLPSADSLNGEHAENLAADLNENAGDSTPEDSSSDSAFSNGIDNNSAFADGSSDSNLVDAQQGSEVLGENAEVQQSTETTKIISSFIQFELSIFGEFAPYDRYILKDHETFIGRDEKKCQIILNDPEVSTIHAVIKKTIVSCNIEDLDSSNGTILNGARINESELNNNDEFVIGSTTFKLIAKSQIIQQEEERLMPVEDNQEIEVQEVIEEEVSFDEMAQTEGNVTSKVKENKSVLKDPSKRKNVLIIVIGIIAAYVFLSSDEEENKKDQKKEDKNSKYSISSKKEGDGKGSDETKSSDKSKEKKKKKLTLEERAHLEKAYQLAKEYFENKQFKEAQYELDKIYAVSEDGYKQSNVIRNLIQEAYKELAQLKKDEQRKLAEAELKREIEVLVAKAKEAVKERNVTLAEGLFKTILQKDPEQPEVGLLKMEIEAWSKEEEKKQLEKSSKEAERQRKVTALSPGKTFFLKKDWYKAINKLEIFLNIEGMDEDLTKESTDMLTTAKKNLAESIEPLYGKAKSLKEGQDLKGSYSNFLEILKIDPSHVEALNEVSNIRRTLENRARKLYREAIIYESLSLFTEAREKFNEVQQISPEDSLYYKLSTDKLLDYLD